MLIAPLTRATCQIAATLAIVGLTLVCRAGTLPEPAAAIIDQYCAGCHDAEAKKGGLDLTTLVFAPSDPANFKK